MDSSYQITKKQYDYLLPVMRDKLLFRTDRKIDKFYFIGTYEEYKYLLDRCKYLKD